MKLDLDTREFGRAMQFVVDVTGKSAAEVLNRGALHAVIGGKGVRGAMQRTRRANRGAIRAKLTNGKLAIKIVMARARAAGIRLTRHEISVRARKLISSRVSAAGYTAIAGWFLAARAFGGRGGRTIADRFAKSQARFGGGKKAAPNDLLAELRNTAPAAPVIGLGPLQDALNDVAQDMTDHATKKFQRDFDRVAPRR